MDEARTARRRACSVRRSVLGDAHVDRAEAAKSDLDAEFQDLITRYAWGEIWTRPGLPRHTRSLLTIGLMVALNRGEELRSASACRREQRSDSGRDSRGPSALRHLLRRSRCEFGVPRGQGNPGTSARAR